MSLFHVDFFFLLVRTISGGGGGGGIYYYCSVDAVLNHMRKCRKVQHRRFRVRRYNAFKFTSVQSNTRTDKNHGQNTHLFYALIFRNTRPRPLAPPQECPQQCGIHRSYHDGVGNRCFRFCQWGSVWSHASRRSMQPERSKGDDNYQHVVIRLRGRFGRARPEHDVGGTREGSRRYRGRVREHIIYLFLVSSHSPLFLLLFLVISFIISNFDTVFVSLNLFL